MAEQPSLEEIKQQCIFCHIIAGAVASKKVYEDKKVVAVLDINPANPGHVLILPKEHYAIMPQISDDDISYIGMITKAISHSLLKAFKAEGTTVFIANGVAAGQRAQHFMVHVIPRMENDGVDVVISEKQAKKEDLQKIATALKPAISRVFGIKLAEETNVEPIKFETKKEESKTSVKKEESKKKKIVEDEEDNDKTSNLDEIANFLTRK